MSELKDIIHSHAPNAAPALGGEPVRTWHIHIGGIVQGVGFRPFVWQLAGRMGLRGWVSNNPDGVHIEINATVGRAENFYLQILGSCPERAVIQQHSIRETTAKQFDQFYIKETETTGKRTLLLTPDYALCADCRNELHQPGNYRYRYPFITCTQCGPRYSIIQALPYDREHTTMATFTMCAVCGEEYNNPGNRRHYSQTNSCARCGVTMQLFDQAKNEICNQPEDIVNSVVNALQQGKIIAVKGIGGYLILCDAGNASAIGLLRQRKHRPAKPFAIMYPDVAMVVNDFEVNDEQIKLLMSAVAPIVLLPFKHSIVGTTCTGDIAPGLTKLGVLLPYAPLFEMILSAFKKPVVATSGNISGASIVFEDDTALNELSVVADLILIHNRQIVVPQDDSVLQLSHKTQTNIIHRRSRGMAPSFFGYAINKKEAMLSMGALLKSSFCLAANGNVNISPYLGNTDSYEARQSYRKTVQHYLALLDVIPAIIITDKHPQYFSHEFAKQLSVEKKLPLVTVQHHKAHFAAVLAENNLLHSPDRVIGVIWDGTGLGDDGQVWGGEFFLYAGNTMQRCTYFDYFPVIGGDKMAKEPRLSALSACYQFRIATDLLKGKFTPTEWAVYEKILTQQKQLRSSSAGRLFDAVACLLNLSDKQSYEGEAAMLLEEQAAAYFNAHGWEFNDSYFTDSTHDNPVETGRLMGGVVADIKNGLTAAYIAAKFHYSMVQLIASTADRMEVKMIACSGGVFQNAVLVDLCKIHLEKNYSVFFHKALSPNDENISFGQMVYYDNDMG